VSEVDRRRGCRLLAAFHLVQGALLLVQPTAVVRAVAGDAGTPPSWIVRILGVRTLTQSAAEGLSPTPDVMRVGVAVDLAHATSMLVAARVWPRYRRAALISAGAAGISAVLGTLLTAAS
jgi:hypothetical protein